MDLKFTLKQYCKMFAQNCVLPFYYTLCRQAKMEKRLVIFADAHHNSRPGNMDSLYEYLTEKDGSGKQDEDGRNGTRPGGGNTTAGKKNERFRIMELYLDYQNASFGAVMRHMLRFMKYYARAEYVVICDNFLPVASCKKRPETKVIQLWHACGAYKKFGYDTEDDIPKNYHGNVFRNIDLVTVSADCCVKPFASAMRLPEECVRPLGVCRTDVYFQKDWQESCRREFYQAYPQAKGKKIALWAPTFRGKAGEPELLDLDLKRLQASLGEEWLVLTRVHPHMMKKYGKDNCSIVTERLFPVTDVLIADYSSLIYEYLLFGKPLVLYVPDLKHYEEQRGFYLKIEEIPGQRIEREEELPHAIEEAYVLWQKDRKLQDGDREGSEKKKLSIFMERYMSGCDGHATERVAAYMEGEGKK